MVVIEHAVVLVLELANGNCHPALLIAVVVNATHLPYFPAESEHFK